jgi:hypothetical protein
MSILFATDNANALLTKFKKAIDDKHVVTWGYDKDGDFYHTTDQWINKAWLRPKIGSDGLTLSILKPQNNAISAEVYAIYHGRFIESMLAHCDTLFKSATASALPSNGDIVK